VTLTAEAERVLLLAEDGREIGTASKAEVRRSEPPRHLAFTCHVRNASGQVLVTRRALGKATWPGLWSTSFCGHPQPAETITHALHRRAEFELGLQLSDVALALPVIRYRTTDTKGVVENEICPVYLALTECTPAPHPDEVMDFRWAEPAALGESVRLTPWLYSPWLVFQAERMPFLGGSPARALVLAGAQE
jgi:isopentenyl-diphosphate delta-isomerase